jgi:hypothetical protein
MPAGPIASGSRLAAAAPAPVNKGKGQARDEDVEMATVPQELSMYDELVQEGIVQVLQDAKVPNLILDSLVTDLAVQQFALCVVPRLMTAEQKLQGALEDVANTRQELQSQRLLYLSLHRAPPVPDTSTTDAASETSWKRKREEEEEGEASEEESRTPGQVQLSGTEGALHDEGEDGDDEGTRVEELEPAEEPPQSDAEDVHPQRPQTFSYVLTPDLPLDMQVDRYEDSQTTFEIRTPYIVAELQAKQQWDPMDPDQDESDYSEEDDILYTINANGRKKQLERGPSPPLEPDYDPVEEDDDSQQAQSIQNKNARAKSRYIGQKNEWDNNHGWKRKAYDKDLRRQQEAKSQCFERYRDQHIHPDIGVYQTAEHALVCHNRFGGSLDHHIFYNRETNQWYTGKTLDCAVQQLVAGQSTTVNVSGQTLFRFAPFGVPMTAGELDDWHTVLLNYPKRSLFTFGVMTFEFSDRDIYEMFEAVGELGYVRTWMPERTYDAVLTALGEWKGSPRAHFKNDSTARAREPVELTSANSSIPHIPTPTELNIVRMARVAAYDLGCEKEC